jgi:hypothetical protein
VLEYKLHMPCILTDGHASMQSLRQEGVQLSVEDDAYNYRAQRWKKYGA